MEHHFPLTPLLLKHVFFNVAIRHHPYAKKVHFKPHADSMQVCGYTETWMSCEGPCPKYLSSKVSSTKCHSLVSFILCWVTDGSW